MPDKTVTVDYRARIIAFDSKEEAKEEAKLWNKDGFRTRIIKRNDVYNVLVYTSGR